MDTLRNLLQKKSNDYIDFEPFIDASPISTSVIMPVFGETSTFLLALQSIQHELTKYPEGMTELIIVDDGSERPICEIPEVIQAGIQKLIRNNTNMGRAYSRNIGINASANELLVFLDSDMVVWPGFLAEHWAVHNHCPVACVAGIHEKISPSEFAFNKDRQPRLNNDFRFYKVVSELQYQGRSQEVMILRDTCRFRHLGYGRQIHDWTLPRLGASCDLSIRLAVARQVRGFDQRFEGWGYEDNHFVAKAISVGCYLIPSRRPTSYKLTHRPRNVSLEEQREQGSRNRKLYEELLDECVDLFG